MSDTTADEASTGWDATASTFRMTLACHPDVRRVGEVADLAPDDMAMGVCRLFPSFGPAGWPADRPIGYRRVSRQPVCFDVHADGLTLRPTATTRINGRSIDGPTRISAGVAQAGFVVSFGKGVLVHIREHADGLRPEPPLLGISPEMTRIQQSLRRLGRLDGPVLVVGPASRDTAVRMLADLRPTNGAIAEVLVASAGSGPELHQALTVAAQDAGVLWLRDLAAAAADRVPVIEQLLSQRSGGPRVVATAERLEDVPEALRKRFDDTVVLPGQLDAEDVAWHLGRGLVERLTEVDRVELVDRDPGWMLSATLERLLTVPWKGDSRDVGNLARRLALESPDTAMEIPVQSAEGVLSDADLLVALESQAYRISATARSLSMSPNTLRKRMSSMGLPSASDLQTADIEAASAQTGGDVEEMARMLRVSAQGLRLRMSRTS